MLAAKRALTLSILVLILFPGSTLALNATKPQGISMSPFEENITVNPGDVDNSFPVVFTNHTAQLEELSLAVQDFGSLNDTGGVFLEGSNAYTQKYGLAEWLSLQANTVDLNPGESDSVLATVTNQTSLSPGGHYGAIVATITSPNAPTGNSVTINQQLVSLILVDKIGGAHFNLKLNSITHDGNWLHLPSTVTVKFQNPGNVQVVPRGTVQLVSPSGRVLKQGIINTASGFVLPETFREIPVTLSTVNGQIPLPGPYRLRVNYRYDGITNATTNTYYLTFVDLPLYIIIVVLLGAGAYGFHRFRRPKNLSKKST